MSKFPPFDRQLPKAPRGTPICRRQYPRPEVVAEGQTHPLPTRRSSKQLASLRSSIFQISLTFPLSVAEELMIDDPDSAAQHHSYLLFCQAYALPEDHCVRVVRRCPRAKC